MFGLIARLFGGIFTPVIDQIQDSASRLLRKIALLLVAAVAATVVVVALTIAFGLWIASLTTPVGGVLAVATLYAIVAAAAASLALYGGSPRPAKAPSGKAEGRSRGQDGALNDQVDAFATPLLNILQRLGLRREQLAVLTGMSVAKRLGPIPLVGLAIIAGFLVGRLWKSWGGILSSDVVASILSADLLAGLFRPTPNDKDEHDNEA